MSTLKNDRLDAMIMLNSDVLAEKNKRDLMSVSSTDIKIPQSVERRIKKRINREYKKREYGIIYTVGQRIAVVVLVVCTALFSISLTSEAVRKAIWRIFFQFHDEYIDIDYESDVLTPSKIETKKQLTAIPEEWTSEVKMSSFGMYIIEYQYNGEDVLTFKQKVINTDTDKIDNENTTIEDVIVNGEDAKLFNLIDKEKCILVWSDGYYVYEISYESNKIDTDTAIRIAESLK